MKLHQLFKKNRHLLIVLLIIVFIGILLFFISISDNDNYHLMIRNSIRDLNTELLNHIYIEKKLEEKTFTKKSNEIMHDEYIKSKNNNEEKINDLVEPVSTINENNTQLEQKQLLDEVYAGLKFIGSMTAYGKDCCGSDSSHQGITSSGYDLKENINYNDPTYGNVRIVASDNNFKLYSIIRVNDPIDGVYNAIVLDRAGSVIGLNKTKKFDLAVESEAYASSYYGVHNNVSFEVLRVGR